MKGEHGPQGMKGDRGPFGPQGPPGVSEIYFMKIWTPKKSSVNTEKIEQGFFIIK